MWDESVVALQPLRFCFFILFVPLFSHNFHPTAHNPTYPPPLQVAPT